MRNLSLPGIFFTLITAGNAQACWNSVKGNIYASEDSGKVRASVLNWRKAERTAQEEATLVTKNCAISYCEKISGKFCSIISSEITQIERTITSDSYAYVIWEARSLAHPIED